MENNKIRLLFNCLTLSNDFESLNILSYSVYVLCCPIDGSSLSRDHKHFQLVQLSFINNNKKMDASRDLVTYIVQVHCSPTISDCWQFLCKNTHIYVTIWSEWWSSDKRTCLGSWQMASYLLLVAATHSYTCERDMLTVLMMIVKKMPKQE